MAQKIQVLLVDDLDGGEASETITFAVDGVSYEIDLADKNAQKFRKALQPFQEKARQMGRRQASRNGSSRTQRPKPAANVSKKAGTEEIRQWAKEQGMQVADRGRIAANIVKQYEEAH